MPFRTSINKRNAAINHGRIVSTKSQKNRPILEVLKLIDVLLSIGVKTTARGWNIPTCWRLRFVLNIVSSMPQ